MRWDGVLDEAERTAGLLAVDHEANPESGQTHHCSVVRAEPSANRCCHRGHLFRWTPRQSIVARAVHACQSSSIASNQMTEKRKYELKKRAETLAETRR